MIKASYTLPQLARMAGLVAGNQPDTRAVRRALEDEHVPIHRHGRKQIYVYVTDLQTFAPKFWEAIQTVAGEQPLPRGKPRGRPFPRRDPGETP